MHLKSFASRHDPFQLTVSRTLQSFPTPNHLQNGFQALKPSYHCFNIGKIRKKIVILFRKHMSQLCFCNFGTFV